MGTVAEGISKHTLLYLPHMCLEVIKKISISVRDSLHVSFSNRHSHYWREKEKRPNRLIYSTWFNISLPTAFKRDVYRCEYVTWKRLAEADGIDASRSPLETILSSRKLTNNSSLWVEELRRGSGAFDISDSWTFRIFFFWIDTILIFPNRKTFVLTKGKSQTTFRDDR